MAPREVLHSYLADTAAKYPHRVAVIEPGEGEITYETLDALSNRLRDRLSQMGVQSGDRVGIYLSKSIDAVAAIFGILKAGAAYVPVDPTAPAQRNTYILQNCEVKVVIIDCQFVAGLKAELDGDWPQLLSLDGVGGGSPLALALRREAEKMPASPTQNTATSPDDLAYILYTSGSTGKPKGVMVSHRAATSFVNWCSQVFTPTSADRCSSHAPFHFDLSILDIYLPLKHGAALVLINAALGKDPMRLAPLIAENKITIWYSTPSILTMLAQYGKLERYDYTALRTVLFAGEVFPIKHLRTLHKLWPHPQYFNLYGPTETNVCTYFAVPAFIPSNQITPFPIGKACSHYYLKIVDEQGGEVAKGVEGELLAGGPGVMDGYWQMPARTNKAFHTDSAGKLWYKTGDVVLENEDGNLTFVGRRDRMVKKRGYRIELGEIEAGLYRHPDIEEAAVVAVADEDHGVIIKAFLNCHGQKKMSIIELKRFCKDALPQYMIPDLFHFHGVLPKTSTDKINYQALLEMG